MPDRFASDRDHLPLDGCVFASAARTAAVDSADIGNAGGCGLIVIVDVTAISGTPPTLTVTVQGKDACSGKYYTLGVFAGISTVSTNTLMVHPALTAVANSRISALVPKTWRVSVATSSAESATYSIGACVTP